MRPLLRDEHDRRIVAMLIANARQSTASIAKKLGLARTTIHERIDRLERVGVIQGYTAIVGGEAPGAARCVILLSITQRRLKQVVERLGELPEIKTCLAINGEFDLMLTVEAPLNEDIDAVIDEVAAIEGVERSRSLFVLSTKFDRARG